MENSWVTIDYIIEISFFFVFIRKNEQIKIDLTKLRGHRMWKMRELMLK